MVLYTAEVFPKRSNRSCERNGSMKHKIPLWVTYVLIFASIACMAFGIYRGEVDTVLKKAVNICMECIGLG